jgi:multidrug resistance efflux pump
VPDRDERNTVVVDNNTVENHIEEPPEAWPEETGGGKRAKARSYFRDHPRAKWVILAVALLLALAVYLVWRHYSVRETTDDAQVDAHIIPVSARVGGTVTKVNVENNTFVKAGEILVQLDPTDYNVALQRAEADYREAVLDAVVAGATVEVPEALVEARARELWDRMLHSLGHQGISKDAYLGIAGKSEDEIVAEAKPDAEQALRREAVIAAVIEAEQIEPSDGDVLAALQPTATREGTTPEKLRQRLESSGRLDDLREDLAQRAAIDFLVEHANPIDPGRAAAREKLWTPDKG